MEANCAPVSIPVGLFRACATMSNILRMRHDIHPHLELGKSKTIRKQGQWVWIDSSSGQGKLMRAGQIISFNGNQVTLKNDDEVVETIAKSLIKPMHSSSSQGVEDMIALSDLHESSLLFNLKRRYKNRHIYTYTGSILVAVNPYQILSIYDAEHVRKYRNRRLGDLPPHIFCIADEAYHNMISNKHDQCVVISGESGAGKTESTKLILQYLAQLSGKHSLVEDRILDSSPILEAFGNAKTVRNNNSSRFGKFIEIQFSETGGIVGAQIHQYLLEKSRIVNQAPQERNYHCFYNIIHGMSNEEKATLNLKGVMDYNYLKTSQTKPVDGINDVEDWERLKSALETLGFNDDIRKGMFKVLAAVLHLGNVQFSKSSSNEDASTVNNADVLAIVANLLQIDQSKLQSALTTRSTITRGEKFVTPLTVTQANDSRDALAKALYGRMFSWIVSVINKSIFNPEKCANFTGVLDIFGFEDFESNSFEQFSINYANERLQQFFIHHIFKQEQEEYKRESIPWDSIDFVDNQGCLDLIAKKPLGILLLLDEESNFPKATEKTLLDKLHQNHEKNPFYEKPRQQKLVFSIVHYAGKVTYDVMNFLDKNRDTLREDIEQVCNSSTVPLIHEIFQAAANEDAGKKATVGTISRKSGGPGSTGRASAPNSGGIQRSNTMLAMSAGDSTTISRSASSKGGKSATVGSKFNESLSELIATLSSCDPYFVRCVKPNTKKVPGEFENDLVICQLRYSGLLETVKIRKAGYPIRREFEEFFKRYQLLLPPGNANLKDFRAGCEKILKAVSSVATSEWRVGLSKLFLRESLEPQLDRIKYQRLESYVIRIQKNIKAWYWRRYLTRMRKAVLVCQKVFRKNYLQRQKQKVSKHATRIQAAFRGFICRRKYMALLQNLAIIQAVVRMRAAVLRMAWLADPVRNKAIPSKQELKEVANEFGDMQEYLADVFGDLFDSDKPANKDADSIFEPDALQKHLEAKKQMRKIQGSMASLASIASVATTSEVGSYEFSKFAKAYFDKQDHKFAAAPLNGPLIAKLPANLRGEAVAMSQVVMAFSEDFVLPKPLPAIEMVRFVINKGISSKSLRDEIYCQLCKQTTNNPKAGSNQLMWCLLSLCIGCFPPSDKFEKYLMNHISEQAPETYKDFCIRKLQRTVQNGARSMPPCYAELKAAVQQMDIPLDVILPNKTKERIQVDSAMLASELVKMVANRLGIENTAGFSMLIEYKDLAFYLEDEKHVMDAYADCERDIEFNPMSPDPLPWKLSLAMESIMPFEEITEQAIVDLVYEQIITLIGSSDYESKVDSIAKYLAIHYIVIFDANKPKTFIDLVNELLHPKVIAKLNLMEWDVKIMEFHQEFTKQELPIDRLKKVAIDLACKTPLMFSKSYRVHIENETSKKILGNEHDGSRQEIRISIDRTGIYFLEAAKKTFKDLIDWIELTGSSNPTKNTVVLETDGMKYTIISEKAAEIFEKLNVYRDLLVQHSKWCMGLDRFDPDDDNLLSFQKGDIIEILERDSEKGWFRGKTEVYPKVGWFPQELVVRLPSKPKKAAAKNGPESIIAVMANVVRKPTIADKPGNAAFDDAQLQELLDEKYSMLNWANVHFREQTEKVSRTSVLSMRKSEVDVADWGWKDIVTKIKWTRNPISFSLNKLSEDDNRIAVEIFQDIMRCMGDYPGRNRVYESVESILAIGLKRAGIRDEIYCQIIRQLTQNRSKKSTSEQLGWALMKIFTQTFSCSASFAPFLRKFLHSHSQLQDNPFAGIAGECFRFHEKVRNNGNRKNLPLRQEIEAVMESRVPSVAVHLPDGNVKKIEMNICTMLSEVVIQMCRKLDVEPENAEQFSIWLCNGEQSHLIFEKVYIMDSEYIQEIGTFDFRLNFKRLIWLKQEVPKNSRMLPVVFFQIMQDIFNNKYRISIPDAVFFGALHVLASDSSRSRKTIGEAEKEELYKSSIPTGLYANITPGEWVRQIDKQIADRDSDDPRDVMVEGLKKVSEWPMFGASFYDILKPKCEKTNLPEKAVFAVNMNGIKIVDTNSKIPIVSYEFGEIASWRFSPDQINLKLGGMLQRVQQNIRGNTAYGAEICHVISLYVKLQMDKLMIEERARERAINIE